MIKIIEDTPHKIPGLTSIFIKIETNSRDTLLTAVDMIKQNSEVYVYSKKTNIWEVPLKNICNLIDDLSLIDELRIINHPEHKNATESLVDPLKFKTKPFDYQLEGINYGINHNKWLLLDDCGLGKTLQTIYIAQELYEQGKIEHCLIICGVDSLRSNWQKEIEKHSNLSSIIIGNRITNRGTISYEGLSYRVGQLQNKIDEFFIITTLTTIRNDDIVKALNSGVNNVGLIVLDECHKCKDSQSQNAKHLIELDAPYKMAMSGSLIVNNPLDCYVALKWINVEKSTLTNFKKFFCIFNEALMQYKDFKNIDVLKEELASCSLRRLKDEILDLPKKNIINEYVDMDDTHRKTYYNVVNGVKDEIDKVSLHINNLLGVIVRLRQATSCPQILTTNNVVSSKIIRCLELVDELLSNNTEKVVIFSGFKDTCDDLYNYLKQYNPLVITGDTKEDLQGLIDVFQNDNEHRVIIATYQKLGTGVTLNRARYMIFIDCPWTSSDYIQACDRIYRIGTTKPVFIYNLINVGTIDERVIELINDKKALSDYIVDDKIENDSALENLRKYIMEL